MAGPSFLKTWEKYLGILCCPECAGMDAGLHYQQTGGKEYLECERCRRTFDIINGIPVLLPGERGQALTKAAGDRGPAETTRAPAAQTGGEELEDWKYLSYQYYSRHKEFLKSVNDFDPEGTVLDIGCAGGSLAKHFRNYIGLDLSWKLISFARSYMDRPFVLADAGSIPFKTKSLSHFISRNMLEHTTEDRKIVREAARVCKRSGVFELPCSDGISILFDPINVIRAKMGKEPKYIFSYGFGHINMQTKGVWEERLRENNFVITGESSLGRGIIYKLNTLAEFILFSFGDNDDIPARQIKKKYFKYIHPLYDVLYKLDPRTSLSWSKVFKVEPRGEERNH